MNNKFITIILVLLSFITVEAQNKQYKIVSAGFYNLENLFDTVDDPKINDEEFLPDGKKAWTEDKYQEKLGNIAYVISQIGIGDVSGGLSFLGVSEIENRNVLEDLVKQSAIANRDYQIIHYDSPDFRGIDVALLYNPKHFQPIDHKAIPLILFDNGKRRYTRDVLYVKGILDNTDTIHVLVNHWPSRGGGEKRSAPSRNKAAQLCRMVYDSLIAINPETKLLIMGDLNDDPTSPSIKSFLKAKPNLKSLEKGGLFNPYHDLYRRGQGSNAYRDAWSLFDQIIISEPFVNKDQKGYTFLKANIFNKDFLKNQSGQYKGYPFRTFDFDNYQGGYSDHFPAYIYLVKEDDIKK